MKDLIKRILRESLLVEGFQDIEYHVTSYDNIIKIINENKINLSSGLGTTADRLGNKFFFLSLSRIGFPGVAWGAKYGDFARIVFDGRKLSYNFKGIPVNYWGSTVKSDPKYVSMFEYEDRLVTDKSVIENIKKYIIRIEVLCENRDKYKFIKKLIEICRNKNVDIFVYGNKKDMVRGINTINDEIMNSDEEENNQELNRYDSGDNKGLAAKLAALILYDNSYIDNSNYHKLMEDLDIFFNKFAIEGVDKNYASKQMEYIFYGSIDFLPSLFADLHNFFKSGGSGSIRKIIDYLVKDMRRVGANNIESYYTYKVEKIKPKIKNIDYTKDWALYELEYPYENNKWDLIDNNKPLKDLSRIYFNSYNYGGQLSDEDKDFYFKLENSDGTVGDFINYLMNKYTLEKVKDIIFKSGYDSYSKINSFKLDKLK